VPVHGGEGQPPPAPPHRPDTHTREAQLSPVVQGAPSESPGTQTPPLHTEPAAHPEVAVQVA
jgi:hypothetical protein